MDWKLCITFFSHFFITTVSSFFLCIFKGEFWEAGKELGRERKRKKKYINESGRKGSEGRGVGASGKRISIEVKFCRVCARCSGFLMELSGESEGVWRQ